MSHDSLVNTVTCHHLQVAQQKFGNGLWTIASYILNTSWIIILYHCNHFNFKLLKMMLK